MARLQPALGMVSADDVRGHVGGLLGIPPGQVDELPTTIVTDGAIDLGQAATITTPTLLLVGGDSPDLVAQDTASLAAALPDVRVSVLEGQQHIAIDLVPELFAERVMAFLRDRPRGAAPVGAARRHG